MKDKKHYIFIIQTDEGDLYAGRQSDVDDALKYAELNNQDIEFKTIGQIAEPSATIKLPMDFNADNIEWFENTEKDPAFIKRAVNAIVNFIR